MTMIDVQSELKIKKGMGAFVDDASQFINTQHNRQNLTTLQDNVKQDAQKWSGLLGASGGKIEISKSFYYILSWAWDQYGNPRPQTNNEQNLESSNIPLIDDNGETQNLQQREVSESHKTLGTFKSIDGNEKDHIKFLKNRSDELAALATTGQFNRRQGALAFSTSYIPAIMYSLSAMRLSEKILYDVQKKALAKFLQLIGFEERFPHAVVFAPKKYGGIAMKEVYTEGTCRKVEALSCLINSESELGVMGIVDLNWQQLHCGTSILFFEGGIIFNYLKPTWFTTIQEFIHKINVKIFIVGLCSPKLYRTHDVILMDVLLQIPMCKSDKRTFNNCRMYFQVTTLSNLTNFSGTKLLPWFYQRRHVVDFIPSSSINWPIQQRPSMCTFRTWVNTLHRIFQFTKTGELDQHLGEWIANPLDVMKITSLIHKENTNLISWDYNYIHILKQNGGITSSIDDNLYSTSKKFHTRTISLSITG
jgi:hypothetical protein